MRPIFQVLKERHIPTLEAECQIRRSEVQRHDFQMRGLPCHCDNCNRMRDEVSKITARIRRVRASGHDNGD